MNDQFAYWKSEIARIEAGTDEAPAPLIPEDRHSDPNASIVGYWRVLAAKTKHDWPCLVQRKEDGTFTVKWGAGAEKPMTDDERAEFENGTFLKCQAVRRLSWVSAAERGQWEDGKISRPTSAEEKHDIIPDTPAEQGGNMIVDEESGKEVDAFWLQIKTKLEAAAKEAEPLGKVQVFKRGGKDFPFLKIESQAAAETAAAIRDTIREIGAMGETKRKAEKKPHDDAAQAVQTKWVPVLEPASTLASALLNGIADWQDREKARVEKEERERVAKETRERLAREAAERKEQAEKDAAEAAARGEVPEPVPELPSAEDIEAQAQQAAAEAPVEVAKPVVQGGAFSKATAKAKTPTARIVDIRALAMSFIREVDGKVEADADFLEYLQKRANAAARAKLTLPGTVIE